MSDDFKYITGECKWAKVQKPEDRNQNKIISRIAYNIGWCVKTVISYM